MQRHRRYTGERGYAAIEPGNEGRKPADGVDAGRAAATGIGAILGTLAIEGAPDVALALLTVAVIGTKLTGARSDTASYLLGGFTGAWGIGCAATTFD